MPRHRTPSAILEARGTFAHDPKRGLAREGEPRPTTDIGEPPAHVTGDVLDAWRDIVAQSHPGVLSACDRLAVEMAAVLMAGFRANPDTFAVARITRLNALLGQFGMTPADRSRVRARSPEKKNRFADLRNRPRPVYSPPSSGDQDNPKGTT